jgi:hypothetical protein
MSENKYLSMQDLQLEHWQAQQKHLRFVQKYHEWIMNESRDPKLKQLHQSIAEAINEALEHLDVLIDTMEKSGNHADVEPGKTD